MKRSLLALLVVVGVVAPALRSSAQTPPPQGAGTPPPQGAGTNGSSVTDSEDQAARLLFNSAREAFQAGNYEVALDRFQQAYQLSHRPQLLYNVGTTLDRLRRDRDALAAFEQFLREAPDSPNRSEVESRVRVLREAVEAEDRQAAEREAQLREQQEALERAQREAAEREAAARRAQEEASDGLTPILFYSVAGGAVALLGVGTWAGVSTNSLNDDYVNAARNATNQDELAAARRAYEDAKSRQTLANAMLFSGAALAVGAGVLVFFTDWDGDGAHEDAQARVRVRPLVSAGAGGGILGFEGRF